MELPGRLRPDCSGVLIARPYCGKTESRRPSAVHRIPGSGSQRLAMGLHRTGTVEVGVRSKPWMTRQARAGAREEKVMRKRLRICTAVTLFAAGGLWADTPPHVQTFPLRDTTGLIAPKVKTEAVNYMGRRSVRITMDGDDRDGLALLPGTDFQDGVIEADIALKTTVPPGVRYPGFVGIAFRVRPDASHYELFYLRPGNSEAPDQAMRNHVVQYASEPGFGWYRLRREWPSVYESHADLAMETWTKVKIEVRGRSARLYVNGSDTPSLVVHGLRGEDLQGGVALWGYAGEEAYFSNLRITRAQAQPIEDGGEAAGTWDVNYASDYGRFAGSMNLHREGGVVTGTWSGAFGPNQPVTGTWRNGFVELSFSGTWPNEKPGPIDATLAGWIDGDSATGRMKVEGRADGQWTAVR